MENIKKHFAIIALLCIISGLLDIVYGSMYIGIAIILINAVIIYKLYEK